ncbi:MAG: carbohydrate ABC transporter permease [Lachnospiraceae bacterium]|jgi:putative aldouronate transport system permease protein|nr:carbohydrate ABC transporter permease [Lachnospiraceae bacterium]
MRQKTSEKIFEVLLVLIMIGVLIATLFPFLNVLAISLNESSDTAKGGVGIVPREFTLENYTQLTRFPALWTGFVISVLRTVIGTVTGLFCTTMLAYCLSRKDYMFRKVVTTMFLLTMYVSGGLIPSFMVIRMFGLNNSFWVYIIPSLISAYNLIIIRSFIETVPGSLQESAIIDGANDLQIYFKIIIPLCKPVLATIALFIAVSQWNSWFDTYLFAPFEEGITTLQYELMKILQGAASSASAAHSTAARIQMAKTVSPLSIRMAITVVTVVPIVVTYPFAQKYFVSGMTLGAVKE